LVKSHIINITQHIPAHTKPLVVLVTKKDIEDDV